MGAATGAGNPCHEVIQETIDRFKSDRRIAVILSLGSGHPGLVSASSSPRNDEWLKIMRQMTADCEKVAQEMREKIGEDGAYFRFSVEQGLQKYQGADVDRGPWINAQTYAYLDDRETSHLLDQCVDGICQQQSLLALEDLGARIRSKVTHKSSCDGDVTFSIFMKYFGDTTDVLDMIIVGCDALQHVVDVAKVRRDSITVYVAFLMLYRESSAGTRYGMNFSKNWLTTSLPSIIIAQNLTKIRKLSWIRWIPNECA